MLLNHPVCKPISAGGCHILMLHKLQKILSPCYQKTSVLKWFLHSDGQDFKMVGSVSLLDDVSILDQHWSSLAAQP